MQTHSRIALVTGGTRGIGFETVRQLAEAGVHTLLAGRNRAKAVDAALQLQAKGLPVEALALDVTDAGSIAAAVAEVTRKHGRLDILVNNAGIFIEGFAKTPSEQTLDTWRDTFEANVFGVVAVTRALLPLLREPPGGRIVNVSSELGSVALHSDPASPIHGFKVPAYNVSKSALNAWTAHLAHELRSTAIKVNAIHPGSVKTDMNSSGELDVVEGAKTSVAMALLGAAGASGSFVHLGQVLPW
jgi:NAD(P)-dependent dehydrogenase (short-subunit alcohol dehydrogenase family)